MNDAQNGSAPNAIDKLFERSIQDVGIPPCPLILERFTTEMRRDEPDLHRLAKLISSDVGLSAGLIKTANSPYFGMRQQVRSVSEALLILGLNTASRAVAGIILRNSFPNVPNLERFWDASARIARLSGWLAQRLDQRGLRPDAAYTFGLFRDCGIPVLLGRFAPYQKALTLANGDTQRKFTDVEESVLPTNHAMVGCILAQSWWLPEEICLAIRNHHDGGMLQSINVDLPLLSAQLIATSQLAEYMVQKQLGLSLTEEWSKLGPACLSILAIEEGNLEALQSEAAPITAAAE